MGDVVGHGVEGAGEVAQFARGVDPGAGAAVSGGERAGGGRDPDHGYDVTDPTAGQSAGEFADTAVQAIYDRMLRQGEDSLDAALKAGCTVETDGITALTKAMSGLTASDARQVYTHLLAASERHLAAFERGSVRP
nr:DUF2202 domain-containing protein [Streptomyces dysideae]